MKRLIGVALTAAISISLFTGCSPAATDTVPSGTTTGFPDRPQDDFYYYVNKDALDNATFEYGANSAARSADSSLVDGQIETIIKDIIAGSGYEKGSEEYLIKAAYEAYLNYDFANEPIPEDIKEAIDSVNNVKSVDELMKLDAKYHRELSVYSFLAVYSYANPFKSDEYVLSFPQLSSLAGVSFTDIREDNSALNSIVTDIKTYMQTLGYDADTANEYGKELANLVLAIYGSTDLEMMDASQNLDYISVCSFDETDSILSNLDLTTYLGTIGFNTKYCNEILVDDKGQLECINSLLTDKNLNALKALKIYQIYSNYMQFIAPHYTLLSGNVVESYDTPEQQAIDFVKNNLKELTDPIYVERYYKKEVDDSLRSMCDDIRAGYKDLISGAEWLTEPTRKGLLEKLDNIVYVTGTDLKRHDNSLYADLGGNLYELSRDYSLISTEEYTNSLGKTVNRFDIDMEMQTVNACYSPLKNTITITAAITNKPFYDAEADYYTNLGGLGFTIAHEMGHAFDSNCIVYDMNGNYNPGWIADEDIQALTERNEKAARYFEDNFTVFGIYHVDGERTLGENFADLSGMECITSLAKSDDDLKKLFESYANSWCCKRVDTSIMYLLAHNEHSPEVIRVNAILSTTDCFYRVYDVKEGDGMYIAPENRISRWH